ncbi:type III PLP-dependent enzyme [Sphingomonadales bacterium 56]|uniref:ornithine decarboxylase n=1 Tax=Sphingobium agri TaxID=2933566 RepID=A0ABT0DWY8_9SPHN|nr:MULTISPECIES: type III PLP-dependent enzyme [Sphingobium]MBY2927619.1 type III PLP-dependent enzyme [Sphingomonadales bacterium 56]MBY2957719.1 type III PLP-dependent enzyme [Sphingomonadales bacterium 58]MCK0531640.1 type III PLP-dependent enzyme [Sphingobium agri]CAD7335592.1 Lysine/ornithine decarboxylase [Sphingobium sp. S6]CAD7335657.1 Lysine/ornithine decarboxylase [Sphingobium sp. S8]
MHKHHSALGVATALKPAAPVTLIRPQAAARAARFFSEKFPGRSLYAVKANPSPDLLRTLWDSGITHYDVASIAEVRLVAETLPQAKLCFMHPVKAEEAIAEAYHVHGVRTFSLDTIDELEKILRATHEATDLELCVRLRVSSEHSELSLASKFGAELGETRELLMATRQAADALGICFHVGSQAMSPQAYSDAIERVRAAIVDAAVTVDIIDVGGGFPSVYPGMEPPALEAYFDAIYRGFESLPISYSAELWCEPGRALSAEYSSIIVRVERRRGTELYINDGAYGALFDAAHVGWRFPVALLREEESEAENAPFSFYGPTCDDMDHMAGPFMLPDDVAAGDYIEIGMLGAYGAAMRTGFNGFTSEAIIEVEDEPMASLYADPVPARRRATVIKLG